MSARILWTTLFFQSTAAFAYTLNGSDPHLLGWSASKVIINEDFNQCPQSAQVSLSAQVAQARAAWNAVPSLPVALQQGVGVNVSAAEAMAKNNSGAPVILCDPQFPKDTNSNPNTIPALTGILVDQSSHRIISAFTLLNADASSQVNVGLIDPVGLSVIIAHEFGHLLGLGHSSEQSALMYYDVSGKVDFKPAPDDIAGVQYIYTSQNSNLSAQGGCGTIRSHHDDSSGTPHLAWLAQLLGFLAAARIFWNFRKAYKALRIFFFLFCLRRHIH